MLSPFLWAFIMAVIPSDIEPYVLSGIRVARARLAEFNSLIASTSSPAPEELDYWNAQVINYEDAITALLLTLETP